ncbi:helix-turn-helix domain-containing protein [Celerinatantimonas sp. MCCC 1A17872]|uniref:helix-turn-helix domain-containing protein n=1 Tax=Celerinatantimonas sp. MCCC 1A17872 TaxID=3177514 RepID=UPI0038C55028
MYQEDSSSDHKAPNIFPRLIETYKNSDVIFSKIFSQYFTLSPTRKTNDKHRLTYLNINGIFFIQSYLFSEELIRNNDLEKDSSEFIIIQFLLSGNSSFEYKNKIYPIAKEVHLIDLNSSFKATYSNDAELISLAIPSKLLHKYATSFPAKVGIIIEPNSCSEKLFKQYLISLSKHIPFVKPNELDKIQRTIFSLINTLFIEEKTDYISLSKKGLVNAVKLYISDHLTDPNLSVEYICNNFFVSRAKLYREFQKEGLGISTFIKESRIKLAYTMITADPSLHIKEVALRVGIESASYLSTCFREMYGIPPSQIKSIARKVGKKAP